MWDNRTDWGDPNPSSFLPPPTSFRNCLLYADYRTEVYTDDQVIVKITVNDHMETNLKRYGKGGIRDLTAEVSHGPLFPPNSADY